MQDLFVQKSSPIHKSDARVKVLFTLCFVLVLNLTASHAWPAYILFWTLILSLVLLSRLPVGIVLKRSLLVIPFILAAFPLIFTGPPPYSVLQMTPAIQVSFSPEGFGRFASILIKSWISVQAAVLLTMTTRFPDLLLAFKQLKIPDQFVEIIGLMWRYLFVIREEASRMLRARASRSPVLSGEQHNGGTLLWRSKVTGGMAGSLLLRSLERSDRVYQAMQSRGYNGEPVGYAPGSLTQKDWAVLVLSLFLLTLLWVIGLLTGG